MACNSPGLASGENAPEGIIIEADGFMSGKSRFGTASPVPFFKVVRSTAPTDNCKI